MLNDARNGKNGVKKWAENGSSLNNQAEAASDPPRRAGYVASDKRKEVEMLRSRSVFTKTESSASLDRLAKSWRPPAVKFAPANR